MAKFTVTSIFNYLQSYAKPASPIPNAVWKNPLYFFAFGLGSGAMPIAPGTFGTLLAIPFYLLLQSLPLYLYIVFVIGFIILSSWACEQVSRAIGIHDHPGMCIDEFAGFFVTMINAPHGFIWIIFGFILFRLFDICKPWPIYLLDEKIHSGFGMVIDDVAAGIYSLIILQLTVIITLH